MTPIKIGFVLLSNSASPIPSTRIAALNMFPFLRAAGFDPHIVFEPEVACEKPDVSGLSSRLISERFEIIFLQKVYGPHVENLTRELVAAGVKTLYCVCDLINVGMAELADATVVVTDYLKQQYPEGLHKKIHVVHDGIEEPGLQKLQWSEHKGSKSMPLRAVLITSGSLNQLPHIGIPSEWLEITVLGRYPGQQQPVKRLRSAMRTLIDQGTAGDRVRCLEFMLSRRIRCIPWSNDRVREMLQVADIGILPIDNSAIDLPNAPPEMWKRKSENRLTLKMSAGLPVIVTPIPSYETVIEHGINGYFAQTPGDWNTCLNNLRDPAVRQVMGRNARNAVMDRFSMEAQSRALINVLNGLRRHRTPQLSGIANEYPTELNREALTHFVIHNSAVGA